MITFDDHPYSEFLVSPMTTVKQNVKELGQLAAKLITEEMITGKRTGRKIHQIPVRIIERASIKNLT